MDLNVTFTLRLTFYQTFKQGKEVGRKRRSEILFTGQAGILKQRMQTKAEFEKNV